MARSPRHSRWLSALGRAFRPIALCGILLAFSSVSFVFSYRDDLLALCAEKQIPDAVEALVQIGARANVTGAVYPEPALIEYLHSLLGDKPAPQQTPRITMALIRAGADVVSRGDGGWTPLMLAAASGHVAVVRALVENGADLETAGAGDVEIEGITPLMAAAMHGHTATLEYLLAKGARVDKRSRAGHTALFLAASRGKLDCVEVLVAKGASVSASAVAQSETEGHAEVAAVLKKSRSRNRREPTQRRPARTPEE